MSIFIAFLNLTPAFDIIILILFLTRMGSGYLGTGQWSLSSENLSTDGYWVPAGKIFSGTYGDRVPARKKILGTDEYRVLTKFKFMQTPGLRLRIDFKGLIKRIINDLNK